MENTNFKASDQVVIKTKIPGRNLSTIKVGTIIAFRDKEQKVAIVQLPAEGIRRDIPVDRLEPAKSRFGRAQVQVNPAFRQLGQLRKA